MHLKDRSELPARIKDLLDARDTVVTAVNPTQPLHEAYNTTSNIRRKGVYAWVHLRHSAKLYIGSYHTTSLFQRTHQHLSTANALSYKPRLPWWRHCHAQQPRQMYKHMLKHGYKDFAVFSLQLLPDDATAREVLYAEQQWMHRFNSMITHGYNARLAHRDVPMPPTICPPSTSVAFKDLCRRVYHCHQSWVHSTLTASNHKQFFAQYLTATLERMYSFCCRGGGAGGVSVTDPLGRWRVPAEFIDVLRPLLQQTVLDRHGATSRAPDRKLIICSYWSTVFDRIDFKSAFTSAAAVAALLPCCRQMAYAAQRSG
jgi:hypothetical protein